MASPQKEEGYFPIANELAEQLAKINLSAYELRIIWAIWRKTWGWNKKKDKISLTQFEKITGLDRRHVKKTLDVLLIKNMIIRENTKTITYGFQKDYDQWGGSARIRTSMRIRTGWVCESVPKGVHESVHTKDNKDTIQKTLDVSSEWYLSLHTDFPNIKIDHELKRFEIWLKDNPRKNLKKTFRNWLLNCKPEKEDQNIEHAL